MRNGEIAKKESDGALPMPHALQNTRDYTRERLPPAEAARAVSRAHALLDELQGAVEARVARELSERCEGIVAKGGPAPAPPSVLAAAEASARHARAGEYPGLVGLPPLPNEALCVQVLLQTRSCR